MSQRVKSYNKQEVDDTVAHFEEKGLQVVKRGKSFINHNTIMYYAIME